MSRLGGDAKAWYFFANFLISFLFLLNAFSPWRVPEGIQFPDFAVHASPRTHTVDILGRGHADDQLYRAHPSSSATRTSGGLQLDRRRGTRSVHWGDAAAFDALGMWSASPPVCGEGAPVETTAGPTTARIEGRRRRWWATLPAWGARASSTRRRSERLRRPTSSSTPRTEGRMDTDGYALEPERLRRRGRGDGHPAPRLCGAQDGGECRRHRRRRAVHADDRDGQGARLPRRHPQPLMAAVSLRLPLAPAFLRAAPRSTRSSRRAALHLTPNAPTFFSARARGEPAPSAPRLAHRCASPHRHHRCAIIHACLVPI